MDSGLRRNDGVMRWGFSFGGPYGCMGFDNRWERSSRPRFIVSRRGTVAPCRMGKACVPILRPAVMPGLPRHPSLRDLRFWSVAGVCHTGEARWDGFRPAPE